MIHESTHPETDTGIERGAAGPTACTQARGRGSARGNVCWGGRTLWVSAPSVAGSRSVDGSKPVAAQDRPRQVPCLVSLWGGLCTGGRACAVATLDPPTCFPVLFDARVRLPCRESRVSGATMLLFACFRVGVSTGCATALVWLVRLSCESWCAARVIYVYVYMRSGLTNALRVTDPESGRV
jgi:hypothetical protein